MVETSELVGDAELTPDQRRTVAALLFTWRDLFVSNVRDVPTTAFIEHSIPLYPGTRPHASKLALYSPEEQQWQLDNLPVSSEYYIGYHHHLSWFITARHVDSALDLGLSDIKYPHKPNIPESIKQVLLRIGLPVQVALVGSKPTESHKLCPIIRNFLYSGRVIKAVSHQHPFDCSVPKGKGGCSTVWNRFANHLPAGTLRGHSETAPWKLQHTHPL